MKKISVMLFVLFCLCFSFDVCASELEGFCVQINKLDTNDDLVENLPYEKDDIGRVTSGSVLIHTESGVPFKYDLLFECESGLYLTHDKENDVYYLNRCGSSAVNGSGTILSVAGGEPSDWTSRTVICPYTLYSAKEGYFFTSIPIFDIDDEDAIAKYCDDGDVSGATNCYDFDLENDGSVELPHDLKSTGSYQFTKLEQVVDGLSRVTLGFTPLTEKVLTLTWSIPSDLSYEYDLDIRGTFNTPGQQNTPWFTVVRGNSYGGDNILFDVLNTSTGKNLLDQYLVTYVKKMNWEVESCPCISVRIRNRVGTKCSDWVVITINGDGSASAKVQDKDGNDVESDEYTNTSGENNTDSDLFPGVDFDGVNVGDLNLDGIMSYITGGFGLLGNGGILALMAGVFSFLPGSVMDIIKFYLAMIVTFSLVAAFIKIVF